MAVKRTYVRRNTEQKHAPVPIGPAEVQRRKEEIESKREYLEKLKSGGQMDDGTTAMQANNLDIGALEKQLNRDEQALKYLAPVEGNASEKRKAQKDFDEAKAYISSHALTLSEVGKYPKPNDPEKDADYGRAVEKSMTMEVGNPEFQKMCNQLKRAASIIDPNDPELRNVNRYRLER
jgi:hypothetical protein